MKLFLAICIVAGLWFEYNLPECGTAYHCGHPIHDILHDVADLR
jgi:hypothetical protein